MQTLKDIFKREDERLNLRNVVFCAAIVVLIVFLGFGLTGMHIAFQQSPDTISTTITVDGENK